MSTQAWLLLIAFLLVLLALAFVYWHPVVCWMAAQQQPIGTTSTASLHSTPPSI
mgnify:CR=1 FL=1